MADESYNIGVYNAGPYNIGGGPITVEVSLEFGSERQYLENITQQALGFANEWTISFWMKPFETTTFFDVEGNQLFRPDGKALLHLKGSSHQSEVLIWGDRVENSVDQEFMVVENWDSLNKRIRVTRFNLAQKRKEWRMFSCVWNGAELVGFNNGVEITDISETYSGTGSFVMIDVSDPHNGRGVRVGVINSGVAQSLDDPYLTSYSGLLGPVTVWDKALASTELLEISSGTFGFDPHTASGTYTSSANVKHWWRLGAAGSAIGDVGFDYVENDISIGTNATISGPNVVADSAPSPW